MTGISRRTFLRIGAGGAAVGAVGVGGLAATGRLGDAVVFARRQVQGCGPRPAAPAVKIGPIDTGEFPSRHMGGATEFAIAYPPGTAKGAKLPLVLALYGREGSYLHPMAVTGTALPYYLADEVARGMAPFAVATVESGPTSYWHKRASGVDPAAMIVEEYLPLLAKRGLAVEKFALHGESMGGFGSLLMAQTLGKDRVAAVAVDGPAIFRKYADTSSVSFDGPDDFAAHDIYANPGKLAGIPVRFVCGSLDPFYGAVKDFAAALHDPPALTSFATACHHVGYWRSETAEQLRFLAGHLAA